MRMMTRTREKGEDQDNDQNEDAYEGGEEDEG